MLPRLPRLSALDVSYTSVTDAGLEYIGDHASQLTSLNIEGCHVSGTSRRARGCADGREQ